MTVKKAFALYRGYGSKCYEIYNIDVRETNKKYIATNRTGLAFKCKSQFSKDELCFTLDEAIRKKADSLREEKNNILERLKMIDTDIEQIKQIK